ncbi:Rhamnogalacturonan acetylesterase [Colletotrichum orbiculare MAFF 240422]|uniref:Rhamnogalacturonan acetylesterase n=1 Tax=Colletotrichum orbiculare (strain 104-T / ATCC 96160 / CBS 514.97 / LARS 414 / MAFF 240422) TaxID=1213857 RepID=N4VPW1_COLOR|nr:Rhamnogalacturonan acetylesterase [Colletotrichum orbiculare MAFF 240422]
MKLSSILASLALAAVQATAAPAELAARAPTLFLCGDSTMARSSDSQMDGWGQYVSKYLNIAVVNRAIGGRSSRSFWNEGRFQNVANEVKAGDIVVIEFGHNDVGSPRSNDNGRSVCSGQGAETCVSDTTGETVYTFVYYIIQASRLLRAKGATVVLSSQTPKNQWSTGAWVGTPSRFVPMQLTAKDALNDAGVTFVDHHEAVSKMYRKLGAAAVGALYIKDNTHTSAAGADLSSQAFVQAISQKMNGTTPLAEHVKTPVKLVY